MKILQQSPSGQPKRRTRKHNRYKKLIKTLASAPSGEWFAVQLEDLRGRTKAKKQTSLYCACRYVFGVGAIETRTEDNLLFIRLKSPVHIEPSSENESLTLSDLAGVVRGESMEGSAP